ncbi:hypothetical protein C8R46DRAFT_1236707 [Mycena filopes]|nr:hypothetical protein C8R46DRAFT_1236707 [Mycena filopes]
MDCHCRNRRSAVFGVSRAGDICKVAAPIALPFVEMMVKSNHLDAPVLIRAQERYDELRDCSQPGDSKIRPCVVVPSLRLNTGPLICLMATFGKQDSDRWPQIFRDFAQPVWPNDKPLSEGDIPLKPCPKSYFAPTGHSKQWVTAIAMKPVGVEATKLPRWKMDGEEAHLCSEELESLMFSIEVKMEAWEQKVRSQAGGAGVDYEELTNWKRRGAGSFRGSMGTSVSGQPSTSSRRTFASGTSSFNHGPSSRQGSYYQQNTSQTSLPEASWSLPTPKPEFTELNFPPLASAQTGTQVPLATIKEAEEDGLLSKLKVVKLVQDIAFRLDTKSLAISSIHFVDTSAVYLQGSVGRHTNVNFGETRTVGWLARRGVNQVAEIPEIA